MSVTNKIILNSLPIILMIGIIPVVKDDYLLAILYTVLCIGLFYFHREKNDLKVFFLGLIIMTVSEYFFLQTHVEVFIRNSLFGIMPIWLPILWAYGFVAIKRSIEILNHD